MAYRVTLDGFPDWSTAWLVGKLLGSAADEMSGMSVNVEEYDDDDDKLVKREQVAP